MGAVQFSIDTNLLQALQRAATFDLFIETGTFQGDTIAAVLPYFTEIHSIEQDPILHQEAVERFSTSSHVTIHAGDSPVVLASLRPRLVGRTAIFWLDAHGCQHAATPEAVDARNSPPKYASPLVAELEAIGPVEGSVFLIDDARYFLAPPPAEYHTTDWPRLDQIFAVLQRTSPGCHIRVVNDVLIAYPPALETSITEYAHTHGMDLQSMAKRAALAAQLEAQIQTQIVNPEALDGLRRIALRKSHTVLRRLRDRTIGRSKQLVQYPPRPGHVNSRIPRSYAAARIPNPAPRISLVTPSFQQAAFLERTLRSVLDQEYPNLEYIVQDSGSTDGSAAILQRYKDRLQRVVIERDDGQADAINRGFRASTGDIMAWLNSDDMLLPGSLAYIADYFVRHPDVEVVYGHRIQIDENDQEIGRWVLAPHSDPTLRWADYVPQESLFWRRSLWERAGATLNTDYQFAIDWELLVRFQAAGARFVRLPRFLAAFRVHDAQKTSRQIEDIGNPEMTRIRQAVHGREVGRLEIQANIYPYLIRSSLLDLAIRWGIVHH